MNRETQRALLVQVHTLYSSRRIAVLAFAMRKTQVDMELIQVGRGSILEVSQPRGMAG